MKLAIGTAQFGLNYGVANRSGRVPVAEVDRILKFGRKNGINTLDTAIAYGESEQSLGDVGVRDWNLITKLPPLPLESASVEAWVHQEIAGSIARLGVKALHGVLLHNSADILGPKGAEIAKVFHALKKNGVVEKTGFSIYAPDSLAQILKIYVPDLVQAPFNIVDRRLLKSGWLQRLIDEGVQVHTRSAFMQGLLLMTDEDRPAYFSRWRGLWTKWSEFLVANHIDPLSACLGFVKSHPGISHVVVGVDNISHLQQLLEAFRVAPLAVPERLACSDLDLIDPVNWKTK